jgi:hypothetical protein
MKTHMVFLERNIITKVKLMNSVRLLFRKNSSDTASLKMKKDVKVFDNGSVKKIQINSDPDNGQIKINYVSNWHGIIQIRIYGHTGYEVYTKSFTLKPGTNVFKIDCSLLNDGMFIIETAIRDPREGLITTYNKIELKSINIV